jgi:hypothetical protein
MAESTYARIALSGSTNFAPVNIAATSSGSPTTIHTADATALDELWIMAANYTNTDATLYMMYGGSSAYQIWSYPIPANTANVPVLLGQTFTGSLVISAYASITNTVSLLGSVNRITVV